MKANFLLGSLKITAEARQALKRLPYDLLARHAINEHGHISREEALCNRRGMKTLGAIISRYVADPTDPDAGTVLITTRPGWQETRIEIHQSKVPVTRV